MSVTTARWVCEIPSGKARVVPDVYCRSARSSGDVSTR